MRGETWTLYEVSFVDYRGAVHRLDTIDAAKIGPWLAEMFTLWPYNASTPTSVHIQTTSRVPVPGA